MLDKVGTSSSHLTKTYHSGKVFAVQGPKLLSTYQEARPVKKAQRRKALQYYFVDRYHEAETAQSSANGKLR
jgi:hypothetical protein